MKRYDPDSLRWYHILIFLLYAAVTILLAWITSPDSDITALITLFTPEK